MPSLAMLCQNQVDDAITAETLREQLLKDWKELEPDLLTVSADNGDDVVALDYGEAYIAVMNIPAPIGDDTVELVGPSRLWPETEAFNSDYQAHAVVTVTDLGRTSRAWMTRFCYPRWLLRWWPFRLRLLLCIGVPQIT